MCVDLDPLGPSTPEPARCGFELLLIADDVVDLVHGGEARWIDLRRTAVTMILASGARGGRGGRLARLTHRPRLPRRC